MEAAEGILVRGDANFVEYALQPELGLGRDATLARACGKERTESFRLYS